MKVLIAALLSVVCLNSALADQPVRLGETYLSNRPDPDYVDLRGPGKANGECGLTHVKLRVRGDGAEIYRLSVRYGNGVRDELEVRERFAPNTESRWIDLRGGRRCVEGVYVYGQSDNRRPQQTRVVLFGLRDGRDQDDERRAVLMGQTEVKGNDKDTVDLGRNKQATCGVTRMSVGAEYGAVELKWIILYFGNGTSQTYNFDNIDLYPGQRTRWIDLAGDQRCVVSAKFKAESRGSRAYVNFYGLIER